MTFPAIPRNLGTWMMINADNPKSSPIMGQFNTNVIKSGGKPRWSAKSGVAGGKQWLRYTSKTPEAYEFDFHAIANDILDLYPDLAFKRLMELTEIDESLGRPPRVLFINGQTMIEGFITDIGDPEFKYWENPLIERVREIGPFKVTITALQETPFTLSVSTSFLTKTDETMFEEISRSHYDDARYSASLRDHNQGVVVEEQIEIPRKNHDNIVLVADVCPLFDQDSVIEGL